MKHFLLLLFLLSSISVFSQELYGYYKKGQSNETILPAVEDYEAVLASEGFTFLRVGNYPQDYQLFFNKKLAEGNLLQIDIQYKILIPFFKVTLKDMRIIFKGGKVLHLRKDSEDERVRKHYENLYQAVVMGFVDAVNPDEIRIKE